MRYINLIAGVIHTRGHAELDDEEYCDSSASSSQYLDRFTLIVLERLIISQNIRSTALTRLMNL